MSITRAEFERLKQADDLPAVADLIRLFLHLVEEPNFVTEEGWAAAYRLKKHARRTLDAMGEDPT